MSEKATKGFRVLLLSAVVGLSFSGTYVALFNHTVPFSIFPLLALGLSAYCLYQRYVNDAMPEGIGQLAIASWLLGLFGHVTFLLVEYDTIGSNMIPTLVCLALIVWIVIGYGKLKALD